MKRNTKFLIILFITPFITYSQNEFLDFIVNEKGDTIYGTIRNIITKKSALYEKTTDGDRIKFRIHRLKKYKTLRFNDNIYTYQAPRTEDGIYEKEAFRKIPEDSIAKVLGNFVSVKKKLPDFIVTNSNDTIYGKIKNPAIGKIHLENSINEKIKIKEDVIKSFRFNNEIFVCKEKRRARIFDDKQAYMNLLLDGDVKLYEYTYNTIEFDASTNKQMGVTLKHYYIEKETELILLGDFLHKKKLAYLFSEKEDLVQKILNEEYTIDNIYLIVKYFNGNK